MAWDFKFDDSGDIVVNELKQLETLEGADRTKQHIMHILKTVRGSDPFDPDFGVDWLRIKRSGYNRALIEHEVRKALAGYDEIKSIDGIEISELDSDRKVRIRLYLTLDGDKISAEVVV